MTLARWILLQAGRDDPVGDLASDAKHDRRFPKQADDYASLSDYLQSRNACEEAHDALRQAVKEYIKKKAD